MLEVGRVSLEDISGSDLIRGSRHRESIVCVCVCVKATGRPGSLISLRYGQDAEFQIYCGDIPCTVAASGTTVRGVDIIAFTNHSRIL